MLAKAIIATVVGAFLVNAIVGAGFCAYLWAGCAPDARWLLAVFGTVCVVQVVGFATMLRQEVGR